VSDVAKLVSAVAVAVVWTACAMAPRGQTVPRDLAERWGCNYDALMQETARLEGRRAEGPPPIPQPGWDACEVLAHNGAPQDVDTERPESTSATWRWRSDDGTHVVNLELARPTPPGKRSPWIVTEVRW
jgi:hypothetical protein